MAVELCKVSFWLEALDPGKPLSFLEHRIQCGNSLLGGTPALMAKGIPDEAFESIEGDDKKAVSALRRQNKAERTGQTAMFTELAAEKAPPYGGLAGSVASIDAIDDGSITSVRRKERTYQELANSPVFTHAKLLADAWCAAFVWKKAKDAPEPITEDVFRRLRERPEGVSAAVRREVAHLSDEYGFFHWHLAFPDRIPRPRSWREHRASRLEWGLRRRTWQPAVGAGETPGSRVVCPASARHFDGPECRSSQGVDRQAPERGPIPTCSLS